jgi:hypothetical protein
MKSGVIPDVDIHAFTSNSKHEHNGKHSYHSRTCSPIPIEKSTEGIFICPLGCCSFPPYLPRIFFS